MSRFIKVKPSPDGKRKSQLDCSVQYIDRAAVYPRGRCHVQYIDRAAVYPKGR